MTFSRKVQVVLLMPNLLSPMSLRGIRKFTPGVMILLGLISHAAPLEAEHVDALNYEIAALASEMDTPESPIIVVDHVTGFDPVGMMYDGHHHNRVGEAWVAEKLVRSAGRT